MLVYSSPKDQRFLAFNQELNGMDDEHTPGIAIEHSSEEGDWVFDPCTGLGCTARHAQRLGRRFLGLELHPRRLANTLAQLIIDGDEPHKIGTLT